MLVDGEWKTYAPDPGTTDAGLSTVIVGSDGVTYSTEPTPTIEWTDAPNPLTPQEMAELKPFIRISGHDDYSYSTPPPTGATQVVVTAVDRDGTAQVAQGDPSVLPQPVSSSVAPQFVEAAPLVQLATAPPGGDANAKGNTVEYITSLDGKTVVMDLIPSVVGGEQTAPATAITHSYTTVEGATYARVNGEEYIQVSDGTMLNLVSANGYYEANVVKSEVSEDVPAAQQGDLMELTAVKLGDFHNGVPGTAPPTTDGKGTAGVPATTTATASTAENHAAYIPISQSQEKTGFKFEWDMPIDKHSVPEVSALAAPGATPAAVTAVSSGAGDATAPCMTLPAADATGSIFLPVVSADSINKNYVPVTPEEISRQFGSVALPAPIAEPLNYSIPQQVRGTWAGRRCVGVGGRGGARVWEGGWREGVGRRGSGRALVDGQRQAWAWEGRVIGVGQTGKGRGERGGRSVGVELGGMTDWEEGTGRK